MTETDSTKRPLEMPVRFIPYLEKHRIYILFKDMIKDLIVNLPKDHLKHLKVFLTYHLHSTGDSDKIILLISPELKIDAKALVKELIKDIGCFVITRRCVMDRYEKRDDYVPGCISPDLMSEVTKSMALKVPVIQAGWLMFDHPCSVREARALQQDAVLPTVTLALMPVPPIAPSAPNEQTPPRNFFQQDFEGLKYAYKATLKEVYIDSEDDTSTISSKCCKAIRACTSGAQGPGQGHHVVGAPGVYRVIIIGPRGSGRRSQAVTLAKHFGLVWVNLDDLLAEARARPGATGEHLRKFGPTLQLKADIVKERLLKKDCIDNGWVMTGYPASGHDFEHLDNMPTPPNRIIILNADVATCKAREQTNGLDWCTGKLAPMGSGPRVLRRSTYDAETLDADLDHYFTEALAELRAAAGITAVEIDALQPMDKVQVKIQAAVIAAPTFDIDTGSQLRNVRAD